LADVEVRKTGVLKHTIGGVAAQTGIALEAADESRRRSRRRRRD
jgi:hypothetical protein